MLFKSLGVAIATNNASNSDQDLKPITIRLADSEIQLYDTVSKSMGLTRQDFLSHVIRSNFRQALKEFVVGYTSSIPLRLCLFYLIQIQTMTKLSSNFQLSLIYLSRINGRRRKKKFMKKSKTILILLYICNSSKRHFVETPKSEEK